jgi:hypothetical protein
VANRGVIQFVLPFALESLNVRDRKHWARRSRDKRDISLEVMAAIGGPRHFPRPAWARSKITVVRSSAGRLDRDNLYASTKALLDVLCARSPRHPTGLGIIEDDSEAHIDLIVKQSIAAPGDGSTAVRIERLTEVRTDA